MTYEEMIQEIGRKKEGKEEFTTEEKTFMAIHHISYEMNGEELALEVSKSLRRYGKLDVFEKEMLSMRLDVIQEDLKGNN